MPNLYSPPNRSYPQELPDRWRFDDGTVRTDLKTLSDSELNALGWHGPITVPTEESAYRYRNQWNPDTLSFDYTELEESEKLGRVSYQKFWDSLLETTAYQRIKSEAKLALDKNVIATEFIALMSDAKRQQANETKIQSSVSEILSTFSFTDSELAEIQGIFNSSGMYAVYTLS